MNQRSKTIGALALALLLAGCGDKSGEAKTEAGKTEVAADGGESKTEAGAGEAGAGAGAEAGAGEAGAAGQSGDLKSMLGWLTPEAMAVSYDRLGQRLDPAVLSVVYALPPKAADLLEERKTLDEALDVVFDGDAEPGNWLRDDTLGFTVVLSSTPYFLRPLKDPGSDPAAMLEQGGFTKNVVEDTEVWLPDGAFPWRVAVLEGGLVAFVPADIPGAGLEPLMAAKEQPESPIETQMVTLLDQDPAIELTLLTGGPLVHLDVDQHIATVQFALRSLGSPGRTGAGYDGQVVMATTGDPHEAARQLNERKYPEENAQVQGLIAAVQFVPGEGAVTGRMQFDGDQLKHFLLR
ncbi:MAG: hypothetical protein KC457_13865 [Myxococcales bacterium]|nr:hypothetical protein [Myxococcales bacterium]